MTLFRSANMRKLRRFALRWLPPVARVSVIVFLVLVSIFAIFRISAPFLISSSLVRSGMETAISQWTGHHAVIGGRPQLDFWPVPKITLNNVTISRPTASGDKVLVRVERLSASFSLFKALRGRPVFHDFHFIRPHLFVARDTAGYLDWSRDGLLADAVRHAKQAGNGEPGLPENLNAPIGSMTIEDGTVELSDARSNQTYVVDGIAADIDWPKLGGALKAYAMAKVRHQDVTIEFASPQPLLLFAGSNATTRVTFNSHPLSGHFEGTANIAADAFLAGNIELNAPDIPALLAWSGARLPSVEKLKSASMAADVMTMDESLRFNALKFSVDDATATGIMDLSMSPTGRPKAAGTLAFDTVDIRAFLAAFSLNLSGDVNPDETLDTTFIRKLELDMRLSVKTAKLDPFVLGDVGASVMISDGKANFDIGDSEFEGGLLTGHLDVAERGFDGGGNLQISIRDADLTSTAERLALAGPLPLGRGSLDLSLKTLKPVWATGINDISGKLHFYSDNGFVRQLDLAAFRDTASQKPFFRMSAAGNGTFDFSTADLDADFAAGTADITKGIIVGPSQTLNLSGVIPYGTNGMALAGTLQANTEADAATYPPLHFFVGGSWPDPVISPVSVNTVLPGIDGATR